MIKLNLIPLPEDLKPGLAIMGSELNFQLDSQGIAIQVNAVKAANHVHYNGITGEISYTSRVSFFRNLTVLIHQIKQQEAFDHSETVQFTTTGVMVDMSRNAALHLTGLKKLIRLQARLGINSMLLYMEDVFAIPEYPYWGYQRGRLSEDELREADDYANHLGIELIPCIQTLGNLLNPMRWPFMQSLADTPGILLVDDPRTYQFLTALIQAASRPFRTNKIHIGMDEAHDLGRGRYLDQHGLVPQTEIMLAHIKKVVAITETLGLKPVMWSDMWFQAAGYNYGDVKTKFPPELKKQIPAVGQMYWDYYNDNQEHYEELFKIHQELGQPVSFATGVWTWNGIAPNYGKTLATMKAGMNAAKVTKLDTVYVTMWGDDGGETPFTAAALGLQYFADQVYAKKAPDMSQLALSFHQYQEKSSQIYLLLDKFDQLPFLTAGNPDATNPSKIILYEDLLYPLYAKNLDNPQIIKHYQLLTNELAGAIAKLSKPSLLFNFYHLLAEVISLKLTVIQQIHTAYQTNNHEIMTTAIKAITKLSDLLTQLRDYHREIWYQLYSPFGWEVLDIRYGGLISRCDSAKWRLLQWQNGQVNELAELEEPQLPLGQTSQTSLGRGLYADTVTVSKISGV